ncbi:unnamed protein product [Acanthoscelides obtectus]|uniref:Uncharacterized protein n=1 Tax=Acanthoscelides obtectus TaxID=200917 RepID=A0A9P0L958_ACAOB|nr:unnamed protein product [Acanthoscelides obtectus]CAK1676983.1 hypothetical protein AOBTE_LOCUS31045 [Acanthoscelides obtectus]
MVEELVIMQAISGSDFSIVFEMSTKAYVINIETTGFYSELNISLENLALSVRFLPVAVICCCHTS